jgi:hypothetical protein
MLERRPYDHARGIAEILKREAALIQKLMAPLREPAPTPDPDPS